MSKFHKGDTICLKRCWQMGIVHGRLKTGVVKQVLPNPYFPEWLSSPNYLVLWTGETEPDVVTKKEIEKY